MQCTQCGSEQTQRLEVIYEQGTTTIRTQSTSVGAAGNGNFGAGTATTTTSGIQQTKLASRAAPPQRKSKVGGVCLLLLGIWLNWMGMHLNDTGWLMLPGMAALAGGFLLLQRATAYNRDVFPPLYRQWQASWLCHRCGCIYQHGQH
jgi:hypothetical protein